MKNKKMLVALVLVVIVGLVGATYAYFTSTATLNNEFKTGTYATSVTEEFTSPTNWKPGDVTTKKVNVTNKGTVDVAARASYTETWTAADGTGLDLTRDNKAVAQFTVGSDWEEATDGYYYYKEILSTNDVSTDFITSVTFNPNFKLEEGTDIECTTTKDEDAGTTTIDCENLISGYAGATYRLNITIETIQADQKWKYTSINNVPKSYAPGEKITIVDETFNIISDNGDTVTMLASNILGTDYKQTESKNYVKFSNNNGWVFEPGPKEINLQQYDGAAKTYVNEYKSYLQEVTGDTSIIVDLITLEQLKDLGCTISTNYAYNGQATCVNSDNADWLINDYYWWTRSAHSLNATGVWRVTNVGELNDYHYGNSIAIRPVITISKGALESL